MCWGDEDLGVPAYLLEQKAVAMNNPNDERPITFSLAELEKEAEVLVSFIRDRHYPGLPAWRYTLRDHMRNLRRLISEDLGE